MTISTNGTCWYPDGSTIAADTPCNDTAAAAGEATPCCNGASLCIANGLCLDSGITTRGSCTDSEWGDGCTQYCREELPAEGAPLRLCNLSLTGSTFACGFPLSNCDEGVNTFTVTSYTLSVARATQLASWASSYGAEVVATTSGVSGSSALPLATGSATGCAADAGSADRYSDGDMAGVGVGVGVPLLLAALAALWLWRREVGRSRKMGDVSAGQYGGAQQMAPQQLQQQQYPHGHFQQQVPYHEIGTDGERSELPPK
ncbi:hypothetical protein HDK77DRAFT_512969 [Phyllosticta capitalensis]